MTSSDEDLCIEEDYIKGPTHGHSRRKSFGFYENILMPDKIKAVVEGQMSKSSTVGSLTGNL